MNFFDQLVIPPSTEQSLLLNLIQIISFAIFYPFTGIMLGGTLLSLYFRSQAKKTRNLLYLKFSNDIIKYLAVSRNAGFGLGILPVISISIVYAQLLYSSNIISVGVLFLSVLMFIVSYAFIYRYKSSAETDSAITEIKKSVIDEKNLSEEVISFEEKVKTEVSSSGKSGLILLILSVFLFIGGTTIASNMNDWATAKTVFAVFVNSSVWLNFVYFFVTSLAISGGAILFFFFSWQGGIKIENNDYRELVLKKSVSVALIFSLLQPVFLFFNFLILPKESFSSPVFIFAGLAFLSILFVCNFLYAIIRNSDVELAGWVFAVMLLTFVFVSAKNQYAFSNAIKPHTLVVNAKADEKLKEMQPKKQVVEISGEEIYKSRCAACHKFETKLVGPPYQETLPKYGDDIKKLAGYIYSPVKINPEYPPMPNQGLKMKEAEAVAKYLLEKYKTK